MIFQRAGRGNDSEISLSIMIVKENQSLNQIGKQQKDYIIIMELLGQLTRLMDIYLMANIL